MCCDEKKYFLKESIVLFVKFNSNLFDMKIFYFVLFSIILLFSCSGENGPSEIRNNTSSTSSRLKSRVREIEKNPYDKTHQTKLLGNCELTYGHNNSTQYLVFSNQNGIIDTLRKISIYENYLSLGIVTMDFPETFVLGCGDGIAKALVIDKRSGKNVLSKEAVIYDINKELGVLLYSNNYSMVPGSICTIYEGHKNKFTQATVPQPKKKGASGSVGIKPLPNGNVEVAFFEF